MAEKLSPGPASTPESKASSEGLPAKVTLGDMAAHPRMDRTGFTGGPAVNPMQPGTVEQTNPLKGR